MQKFVEDQTGIRVLPKCDHSKTDIDIDHLIFSTLSECECQGVLFIKTVELCLKCGIHIYRKRCVRCGKWSNLSPLETLKAKERRLMKNYHSRLDNNNCGVYGGLNTTSISHIKWRMLMDVLDLRDEIPSDVAPHEEEFKILKKLHILSQTLIQEIIKIGEKTKAQKEQIEQEKQEKLDKFKQTVSENNKQAKQDVYDKNKDTSIF